MTKKRENSRKDYPAPFSLRLSIQEREEIKKLADGLPMGQYIKDAILQNGMRPAQSRKPSIRDQKLLAKLLGALGRSRIASNINQLAKAANSGSLPVNEEVLKSLKEATSAILWMRDTLIKAMGLKPQCGESSEEDHDDP